MRHVQLREIAPRTRVSYLAWVRRLHEAMPARDITTLTEGEVLDFLIALRHERELKDSTINQAACALRCFFRYDLGRDWKAWSKIKIRREEQLPNVLSREEVGKFLAAARVGRFRAMFTLMYHCGLRLGEVIRLVSPATSTARAACCAWWVARAPRTARFPSPTRCWAACAPSGSSTAIPNGCFPRRTRLDDHGRHPGAGPAPVGKSLERLGRAGRHARHGALAGLDKRHGKRPVTCHTLRHCFATHLLDAGVSIRLVSQYLGHSSLKPTLVYLHLTEVSESAAREVIASVPGSHTTAPCRWGLTRSCGTIGGILPAATIASSRRRPSPGGAGRDVLPHPGAGRAHLALRLPPPPCPLRLSQLQPPLLSAVRRARPAIRN